MIEIIQFIFHSFWTFLGSIILISVLGGFINDVIKGFIPDKHIHINGYKLEDEQLKKIIEGKFEEIK